MLSFIYFKIQQQKATNRNCVAGLIIYVQVTVMTITVSDFLHAIGI